MKNVQVVFSHDDSGNCRQYYRTLPNRTLICLQQETTDPESGIWYACTDDDCWMEPEYPINRELNNIVIVDLPEPEELAS